MSFRIAVIPEDDRLDKYVLQPVFEAMLAHLGRPRAEVKVVGNPQPRGVDAVLRQDFADKVLARFPMVDLFVYCVDRDAKPGREVAMRHLIEHMRAQGRHAEGLLAHQEVEVWCLVNHISKLEDPWDQVREHRDPKEEYFEPLVQQLKLAGPGQGRQELGDAAGRNYLTLRRRCPEVEEFEQVLAAYL